MAQEQERPDSIRGPRMQIHQVFTGPPPEGDLGQGLLFNTSRGDLPAIWHEAAEAQLGVIMVCGAGGGYRGPGGGTYARVAETLKGQGISTLRLNYRQPNVFPECVLDLLAGIIFLGNTGYRPVVLIGHSFGGAVVIAAGAASRHVSGVVSLASQTYGANMAGMLAPKPLLVVHGKNDTRLPYSCGVQIYEWANEPKELVLYDDAEHRLEECGPELDELLLRWIPATLNTTLETANPDSGPSASES